MTGGRTAPLAASRVLFIFLDGVGLGPDDPAVNPFATADLPTLRALLSGRRLVHGPAEPEPPLFALDARLGVAGVPQSGTGQTTLLTGVNAAARLGEHRGPFPGPVLWPLLGEASLWRRLMVAGRRVAFANAYPDRYLERAARPGARLGAVARSAQLAGVRLRGPADLAAGAAVSAFLTNEGWREHLGHTDIPDISEHDAGSALALLAREHDFTLFEYYATDIAGHRTDLTGARAVLERLDRFLSGVRAAWSPADVLVLAADHGNVEDMSTTHHTLNPALGMWVGPAPTRPLTSLLDVAPAVLAHLAVEPPDDRQSA